MILPCHPWKPKVHPESSLLLIGSPYSNLFAIPVTSVSTAADLNQEWVILSYVWDSSGGHNSRCTWHPALPISSARVEIPDPDSQPDTWLNQEQQFLLTALANPDTCSCGHLLPSVSSRSSQASDMFLRWSFWLTVVFSQPCLTCCCLFWGFHCNSLCLGNSFPHYVD